MHQLHQCTKTPLKPLWNKALPVGALLVQLVHVAHGNFPAPVFWCRKSPCTNTCTNSKTLTGIGFSGRVGALVQLVQVCVRIRVLETMSDLTKPDLTPDEVRARQAELDTAIVELAGLEGWHDDARDEVLYRVERQPLSTLLPDLHWFREQIAATKAEQAARAALAVRCWSGEGFENPGRIVGFRPFRRKLAGP